MKNKALLLLLLIFLGSIFVRLYRFDNPVADWHSWRQADTASVTRNFVQEGYTPFFPKFDVLNSLNETFTPNPNRYFFAEFPLYNSLTYFGFILFDFFTLEQWGRVISIGASSLTVIVLYFLVKHYSNSRIAMFASFLFAFLPFNIYWGRVIMPDALHIFLSVFTFFLVTRWLDSKKILYALLASIIYAGALLTKPYALVLLLPLVYLILRTYKFSVWKQYAVYLFFILSLAPLFLWRWHISQYPEGMFGTTWLYNQGGIRFTGAFFRWIIYDRMNRLIFATGGFVLFWLGVISGYNKKEGWFYLLWLVSIFVFITVIARGNVTHDYYQLPLVPIGCIFMAKGIDFLITYKNTLFQRAINIGIIGVLLALLFAFGWYEIRGYYYVNNPSIIKAGQYVDKNLPQDAIVIAPYQNDTAFLYQTNRHGYTVGEGKIEEYREEGATHLVSVNFDDATNEWAKRCTVIEKNKDFIVVDLTECAAGEEK